MSFNPREFFSPQMKEYDKIGLSWHPYIMFFQGRNFKSNIVNTDKNGFRYTVFNGKNYNLESIKSSDEVSLIVGGSTAFGVGATGDEKTISSILSNKTKTLHLNLAGRAFSSTQELLLFKWLISTHRNIKDVTIISGINDLFLSSIYNDSFMPSHFFGSNYQSSMTESMLSPKRKILKFLFNNMVSKELDWTNISFKNLINNLLKKNYSRVNFKLPKKESLIKVSVNQAISSLDSSLIFWSAMSKKIGFRVNYILQPFAYWQGKVLTKEEELLFNYLDNSSISNDLMLKQMSNNQIYHDFKSKISLICSQYGISFFDPNELLAKEYDIKNKWLYVDRIHLTDLGYQTLANLIHKQIY